MSLRFIIIFVVVFSFPFLGYSQIVPPPIPPPPPPGLPIDGFTSVLLVVGMFYGSKKIFKDSSS
ncbi:PID-CTERM protein-sorting domain-containing protein [uncultured Polaribacter sp.]|mgnify:CR=1 FL=1|uniref:PID-CTERM protein-sorting domain-containing protein n=1 Tax=uncultured Polaribacter sp. TaxID=174711 RepID=UPI00261EAAEC|nr:hypothetical protein [uncultured Polaribacter sp.]